MASKIRSNKQVFFAFRIKKLPLLAGSFLLTLSLALFANDSNEPGFSSNNLPRLGNSDQAYLSEHQANVIGSRFYHQVITSSLLVEDAELNLYLRTLIATLHNSSSFSRKRIRILMINNPEINAFALPGNVIVVHSALFLEVNSEAELAAVLAHEMAHLKQQHILRLFAQQQKQQPGIVLAMLAAIILSSDPQVTNAALSAGIASTIQNTLDYTRKQEYEADRIAIDILLKAGYDPTGMRDFFRTLSRLSGYSGSQSEFLRTHPLNQNRISEAESRIQNIDRKNLIKDTDLFRRLQLKLRIQLHKNTPESKNTGLLCYRLLLLAQQQNKQKAGLPNAICTITMLQNTEYLLREYATLLGTYAPEKANRLFQSLLKKHPEHPENFYAYLKHLYSSHQYNAYTLIASKFLQHNKPLFPGLYKLLSNAFHKTGKDPQANFYLARYYSETGHPLRARKILLRLSEQIIQDNLLAERSKTLLEQIKNTIAQQKEDQNGE